MIIFTNQPERPPRPNLTDCKRVKITLKRTVLSQHDLSISYWYENGNEQLFMEAMISLLNVATGLGAWIARLDTVLDAETSKQVELHIALGGEQEDLKRGTQSLFIGELARLSRHVE
jgi:hypothetical protein